MSGGVDSTMAAILMQEAGHDVIGMTMRLYDAKLVPGKGRGGTCCSPAEVDRAKLVCDRLGIPHYTVDEGERFQAAVIDDFVRAYAAGETPNPCVRCNERIKFTPLLTRARALGAEQLVTGHYARAENGRLYRGVDPAKDQTYFLFAMGREALAHVHFPLAGWTKDKVREKAKAYAMPNHATPDSQEICFVPNGDHAKIVERRAVELGLDLSRLGPGRFVDRSGNVLGEHAGIHRVTIGQRRGLALATGTPRYVLNILPDTRDVVVGDASELQATSLVVRDFRELEDLAQDEPFAAQVQIRHRSRPSPAMVTVSQGSVRVQFEQPVSAVAPGQAAVIYRGDQVLGGGWIASEVS
jgi:tRNA-specific 2-thiouridylase